MNSSTRIVKSSAAVICLLLIAAACASSQTGPSGAQIQGPSPATSSSSVEQGHPLVDPIVNLIAVLLGAGISVGVSWVVYKRQLRKSYATETRRLIYGPLYEEMLALRLKLVERPFPWQVYTEAVFGAELPSSYAVFRYWNELKKDERRLRVPRLLREKLDELVVVAGDYNEARKGLHDGLDDVITNALEAADLESRIANPGEACAELFLKPTDDAPAEFCRILLEGVPEAGCSAYETALAELEASERLAEVRDLAERMGALTEEITTRLEDKIETILLKYEGRTAEI